MGKGLLVQGNTLDLERLSSPPPTYKDRDKHGAESLHSECTAACLLSPVSVRHLLRTHARGHHSDQAPPAHGPRSGAAVAKLHMPALRGCRTRRTGALERGRFLRERQQRLSRPGKLGLRRAVPSSGHTLSYWPWYAAWALAEPG